MSMRDAVRMSPAEIAAFLDEPRVLTIATVDAKGAVHLVAMWFTVRDGCPVFTTYSSSQKVVNLRRNPRLTGLVEAGDSYDELRGVQLIGMARIIEDFAVVVDVLHKTSLKYGARSAKQDPERVARKRVAIALEPQRTISWDHRKLAAVVAEPKGY